jgi:hypothetical protein
MEREREREREFFNGGLVGSIVYAAKVEMQEANEERGREHIW